MTRYLICGWYGESIHAYTMHLTYGCRSQSTLVLKGAPGWGILYACLGHLNVESYTDVDGWHLNSKVVRTEKVHCRVLCSWWKSGLVENQEACGSCMINCQG